MHIVLKCLKCFHLYKDRNNVDSFQKLNHSTVFLRWCYNVNCNYSHQHRTLKILKIKHFNRNVEASVYKRFYLPMLLSSLYPGWSTALNPWKFWSDNWMNMGYMNMAHLILKLRVWQCKTNHEHQPFAKVNTRAMFMHFFFSFKGVPWDKHTARVKNCLLRTP